MKGFKANMMMLFTSLLQSKASRIGLVFAVIWLFLSRPFWRHFFVALSTMVGALTLARLVTEPKLSDLLLRNAAKHVGAP